MEVPEGQANLPTEFDLPSRSDRELIELIRLGNKAAEVELFVNRYGRLIHVLCQRLKNEDLESELYIRLRGANEDWVPLGTWCGKSKFSTWLGAVIGRLQTDKHRAKGREIQFQKKFWDEFRVLIDKVRPIFDSTATQVAEQDAVKVTYARLLRCLDRLALRDQLLVSMLSLTDPSVEIEKVASWLSLTTEATKVAHWRALKRYKSLVVNEGENHG